MYISTSVPNRNYGWLSIHRINSSVFRADSKTTHFKYPFFPPFGNLAILMRKIYNLYKGVYLQGYKRHFFPLPGIESLQHLLVLV